MNSLKIIAKPLTMKKLLSTKILNEASKQLLKNANVELIEFDFIKTEKIPFDVSTLPEKINYAIFTSAHAVQYFLDLNLCLEIDMIAAMSGKTKDLLVQNEMKVNVWDNNAEKLAEQILKSRELSAFSSLPSDNKSSKLKAQGSKLRIKQVHFFCGEQRLSHLKNALNKSGVMVNEHILYTTVLTPHKIDSVNEFDGVLFFSPTGVESFFRPNSVNPMIKNFCLGETTKKKLNEMGVVNVYTSEKPTEKLLVELALSFQS